MSTIARSKVVSLNGLGRERSPGRRILGECQDMLLESLSIWLRQVAAPISEELFNLAGSTREREKQTRYLDLRADIEKDWPQLVDAFRRDQASQAERCLARTGENISNRAAPLEVPDFEGLQLLADDDLSEHIVIREFAAQLSETCDAELYALDRRVAALLGQEEPIDGTNPLAPPVICQALADACAALGSDAEDRLLLLRRLERHLHLALPPIYQQVNARLIQRSILPELKRSYRRGGAALGINEEAASAEVTAAAATPQSAAPLSGEGILDALQRLVQARSGGNLATAGMTTDAASGTPGTTPDAAALSHLLLTSLNEMQHQGMSDAGDLTVNRVRVVRDSEAAQHVGHLEAVTIDIVAMLFDFIFDDGNIPPAIKALISRLQIPVLKVAILDHDFFADRAHPARRFLGSISGIAVRWGSSVDESDPFYGKLAELVARIQNEFESDVEIFGTALTELEAFVDERENEEESTVATTADLVRRHEQEADAWERAQLAVGGFRERPLPALIDGFLGEHWTAVLQKVALEHDAQSDAWQTATGTMEELAWSIEAKNSQADRLKLISLLPRLLAQLNKGLDSIDADAAQRRAFFDALVEYHSSALKGEALGAPAAIVTPTEPATSPAPADNAQEGDLLVMRSVDHGVQVEEVILVGASPIWRADDREAFRLVSELKRGDWVEFRQEDGSTSRERLTWISPQRGLLVFSNHRSAKAISISPEALARQLRDDNAAIVRDEPLFERALSGVLQSLNTA